MNPIPLNRRWLWITTTVYGALLAAYVIAVLWVDGKLPAPHLLRGGDSAIFEEAAKHLPWNPSSARVAPLYPVLMAALGRNLRLLVIVQAALWGCAWHWLARVTARCCSHRIVRWVMFGVVLTLSLTPELLLWISAVASETLSVLLIVATMACAISALQRRKPSRWAATAGLVALCTLGRDTNAILAGCVVVIGLVAIVRRPTQRKIALVCVAMAASSIVASNVLSGQADPPRWYFPLQENIVFRVTPHPEFVRYFEGHGMPQAADLAAIRDGYFYRHDELEQSPRFEPFRTWLRANGPTVYSRFVLTHPRWQLRSFFNARDEMLLWSGAPYAKIVGSTPGAMFGFFGAASYWRSSNGVIVWAGALLILLVVRRVGWRDDDRALRWLLWLGISTAFVHALIAFSADALETGRHTISATIQLRIAVWVASLLLIDRFLTPRSEGDGLS